VVLHNVPGRLRVRVAAHADTAALEMVLRQQRGVEACRRSAQSLLIRYRSGETTADRLLKVVASSRGFRHHDASVTASVTAQRTPSAHRTPSGPRASVGRARAT